MKRIALVAVMGVLFILLSASVAPARTVNCTGGFCEGTPRGDRTNESQFNDFIRAKGGNDRIRAGAFRGDVDTVRAGGGDDRIRVREGDRFDSICCGGGFDVVRANRGDDVNRRSCERINR